MKIYKGEDGHITIVYGVNEEPAGVTLVKDRGKGGTNMFGYNYGRYLYHWANVSGNTPYSTDTDSKLSKMNPKERYKLVRVKQ